VTWSNRSAWRLSFDPEIGTDEKSAKMQEKSARKVAAWMLSLKFIFTNERENVV
jgi:hypothetical protein